MVGVRRRGAAMAPPAVVPAATAPTLSKYRINAFASSGYGYDTDGRGQLVPPYGVQRTLTHLGGGADATSEQGMRFGLTADHSYLFIIDLPDDHPDDSFTEFSISRTRVPAPGQGAAPETIYVLGREANDERRAVLALAPHDLYTADATVNFLTFDSTFRGALLTRLLAGLSACRCTILEWA